MQHILPIPFWKAGKPYNLHARHFLMSSFSSYSVSWCAQVSSSLFGSRGTVPALSSCSYSLFSVPFSAPPTVIFAHSSRLHSPFSVPLSVLPAAIFSHLHSLFSASLSALPTVISAQSSHLHNFFSVLLSVLSTASSFRPHSLFSASLSALPTVISFCLRGLPPAAASALLRLVPHPFQLPPVFQGSARYESACDPSALVLTFLLKLVEHLCPDLT